VDDRLKLLDGKVAIVTGAGRGIGREHALLLARQGADVLVNDLGASGRGEGHDTTPAEQVAEEVRSLGVRAAVNDGNVADWKVAEEMVRQAVDTFGRLDILINNAGILRDRMSYNMLEEDWDVVVNVVLKGTFAPSRFAAAYWREQSKELGGGLTQGVILNTSSEAGLYGNFGQANYGAAKMGIAAMTITMARELERIGVRVNCIAPSAMTRLLQTVRPDVDGETLAHDPMAPSQIAPLAVWLCSDLAKDVNGQVFSVRGHRIQLLQGWRPVTEAAADGADWTIERVESSRGAILGDHETGIPPFMPSL
jgi:NAD(P)-dependent dehydrogenase (short-subunit alcohol dehydrogenase family)